MLIGALSGAVVLAVGGRRRRRVAVVATVIGALTAVTGSTAYAVATAATSHAGSIPSVGPAGYTTGGLGGGLHAGGRPRATSDAAGQGEPSGAVPVGPGGIAPSGSGGAVPGGPGGANTNEEVVALLDKTDTRWSAAVIGDQSAVGYILSTDTAVMAIGGWTGSDPAPTLAQFQQYVTDGEISYFIAGGGMGGGGRNGGGPGGGGSASSAAISSWVQENFTSTNVGGATIYDLSSTATS